MAVEADANTEQVALRETGATFTHRHIWNISLEYGIIWVIYGYKWVIASGIKSMYNQFVIFYTKSGDIPY